MIYLCLGIKLYMWTFSYHTKRRLKGVKHIHLFIQPLFREHLCTRCPLPACTFQQVLRGPDLRELAH